MELEFSLEEFAGPLDLLLELIKKDEMDIYNIPIHRITSSYLVEMKKRAIPSEDIAEFISMAAYLLEIKSQMLLPDHSLESAYEDDKDPRYYLVHRLLEYQKIKEATLFLMAKEYPLRIYSEDLPLILPKPPKASLDFELSSILLKDAMEGLLNRRDDQSRSRLYDKLKKDSYSVFLQQKEILTLLSYQMKIDFSSLLKNAPRGKQVASFLALLKLAQDQRILLHQQENFSEIEIQRRSRGKS
ncbi:MAG: segregation/condensation protein A [Tissierellia bacterium]|nr:segregation/condensation protein A [Tissierellia bacterium]